LPKGHGQLAPDLVVEVLAPDASPRQVLDKVGEYLAAGTPLIWVIEPKSETAAVYRSLTDVAHVPADGTLDGGEVLPGFQMPLADLFA
jgi:Uma2 family endonuclease